VSTSTWGEVPRAPAASQDRWVAVGRSTAPGSKAAGREAARKAMLHPDAALLIVLCSPVHDLDDLLEGVRAVSGDALLVGSTTAGEIAPSGPSSGGVVVLALGGSGFSAATAAATGIGSRLRQAGAEAAACVRALGARPHRVLMLFTDGLACDQLEIIRGAYGVAGAAVAMVGGAAADDLRMTSTRQLRGGDVLADSVVAAALGSDAPFGIGVRHGWRPFGEPLLVTGTHANTLLTLDDEPAMDVYLGRLEAPAECYRDQAAFTRFAVTHPLGLSRRSGDRLRCVFRADFETRAISCNAVVPSGAMTSFMECTRASVLESAGHACADAVRALGGRPPIGLLAFDCVGRKVALGDEGTAVEVERMVQHSRGAPLAGLYGYGEIARVRGGSGFHNQTLVALAIS